MVARLPECAQIVAGDRLDGLLGAKRAASKWRPDIIALARQIEDTAHRLVIAAANLLKLHSAHLAQLILWKRGIEQHIGDEIEGGVEAAADHLRRVARELDGRLAALARAQRLELLGKLPHRAMLCALEHHLREQ